MASHMALETTKEEERLEFAACLLVVRAVTYPINPPRYPQYPVSNCVETEIYTWR